MRRRRMASVFVTGVAAREEFLAAYGRQRAAKRPEFGDDFRNIGAPAICFLQQPRDDAAMPGDDNRFAALQSPSRRSKWVLASEAEVMRMVNV